MTDPAEDDSKIEEPPPAEGRAKVHERRGTGRALKLGKLTDMSAKEPMPAKPEIDGFLLARKEPDVQRDWLKREFGLPG